MIKKLILVTSPPACGKTYVAIGFELTNTTP